MRLRVGADTQAYKVATDNKQEINQMRISGNLISTRKQLNIVLVIAK